MSFFHISYCYLIENQSSKEKTFGTRVVETVWSSCLGPWIGNLEVPCPNPTYMYVPLSVMVLGSPKFNSLTVLING